MKSKFSKLSVALCLIVTLVLTLVPMFAFSASAAEETTETISFASTAQRVSQDGNSQVWKNGGITFTNDKASSSTAVANYSDPVRIYASSSVTIEAPGEISKVVFVVNASKYVSPLTGSTVDGASFSASGTTVTLELDTPASSITITKISGQTRFNSISVTYTVGGGEGGEGACAHENTTTTTVDATCTADGSITVTCGDCHEDVSYTKLEATGHAWVEGFCDNCGIEKPITPDYSGRYYIATQRSEGGKYFWMTSDLGTASTKRWQAIDSGLTVLPESISTPEVKCVFVLEKNDDDTYYIYTEGVETNNYLAWSSGNSGNLSDKANAIKFTIDVTEAGLFNIKYETRYVSLNNSNNYFAMYEGTQKQNLALVPVVEKAPVKTEITGATVGLGENLSVYFLATLANAENLENYKMIFTINGRNVEAEAFELNGQYAFVLEGLAPQQMADRIDAKLYEGDEVVGGVEDYTIQKFAETVITDTTGTYTAAEKQLVVDMLYYGKAAQEYVDYYVDYEDGNNTIKAEGTATDATPDMEAAKPTGEGSEVAYISAAGVQFDFINRLYIKVKGDVTNVKVLINDVEVELTKSGDAWIAYTDAIAANQFATEYRFELYVDGDLAQELIYSVNAYAFAKWDAANPETQALARALYRYGVAAAAVKTN